jgi:hypothetical protein
MEIMEKSLYPVSITLIPAAILSLFLYPAAAQPLMGCAIVTGIGAAVIFTVNRHYRKYIQGHRNRGKLLRNVGLDVLGILLAVGGAIWLADRIATEVSPGAAKAVESIQPGTGSIAGIVAGLLSALSVGLGIGFSARWIWGKLMRGLD